MTINQQYAARICLEANRHYIKHPHCPQTLALALSREAQALRRQLREA